MLTEEANDGDDDDDGKEDGGQGESEDYDHVFAREDPPVQGH